MKNAIGFQNISLDFFFFHTCFFLAYSGKRMPKGCAVYLFVLFCLLFGSNPVSVWWLWAMHVVWMGWGKIVETSRVCVCFTSLWAFFFSGFTKHNSWDFILTAFSPPSTILAKSKGQSLQSDHENGAQCSKLSLLQVLNFL